MASNKPKNKKNIFYNIIILILIGVIVVCGFKLGKIYYTYYKGSKTYDKVVEDVQTKEKGMLTINWDKLLKQNKDTKAWLYLNKSEINYPVLQGKTNDQYLRTMPNQEYNVKGSIFIDSRNLNPFQDFMTLIYGHHTQDDTMFTDVANYFKKDGFYKGHENFLLLLPNGEKYKLEIIAGSQIKDDSKLYKFYFNNEIEKQEYINQIIAINKIKEIDTNKIKLNENDKIIMMSTCADFQGSSLRYVVWSKMVKATEEDLKVVESK